MRKIAPTAASRSSATRAMTVSRSARAASAPAGSPAAARISTAAVQGGPVAAAGWRPRAPAPARRRSRRGRPSSRPTPAGPARPAGGRRRCTCGCRFARRDRGTRRRRSPRAPLAPPQVQRAPAGVKVLRVAPDHPAVVADRRCGRSSRPARTRRPPPASGRARPARPAAFSRRWRRPPGRAPR